VKALLTLTILAAAISGAVWGYLQWDQPAPVTYRTAELKRATIIQSVSATGNLEPLVKVLVGSQVSGTVTRWYADFNQTVKQGDLLAELDQERYQATIEQRSAAVAVNRARAEEAAARVAKAQMDFDRLSEAYNRRAVSDLELREAKTALDEMTAGLHAAEAQVKASEADLRSAQVDFEKTFIRSPIDGVVISRDVDAGQTVAASLQAPTLFTIANDLTKMRVNAAVSETDIGKIREGMEVQFRVDAYPGRRFRGVVTQVRYAETIVDNVVTYKTMIDVQNEDLALRPGMTATILFEVAKVEDVLSVPNAALRFDPNAGAAPLDFFRPGRGRPAKSRVYKLGPDNTLVEVPLETGLTDGSVTQVLSGELAEGDKVVIEQTGGATRRAITGPPRMPRGM